MTCANNNVCEALSLRATSRAEVYRRREDGSAQCPLHKTVLGFQLNWSTSSPLSLQWPTCKGQLSNKCVNVWMNEWIGSKYWMGESSMCMFEIVNKFKSNQKEDWMENFIVNLTGHKAQQKGADGSERKVTQRVRNPSLAQEETTKKECPLLLMQDPHLQPCNFPLQASWLEISVGPEHVTLCSPRGPLIWPVTNWLPLRAQLKCKRCFDFLNSVKWVRF